MTDLAESDEIPAGSGLLASSLKGRNLEDEAGIGRGCGIADGCRLGVASVSISRADS